MIFSVHSNITINTRPTESIDGNWNSQNKLEISKQKAKEILNKLYREWKSYTRCMIQSQDAS